jgi:hypothetical protein
VDGDVWYGPKDFAYLSFEEMQLADSHFIAYTNTSEEVELDRFMSILYRPKNDKKYGDNRQAFDADFSSDSYTQLAKIQTAEKVASMIWYESQRDLMIENYSECFSEANGGEKQTLQEMMLAIGQGIENYNLVRTTSALVVYADIKRVLLENEKLKHKNQ